MSRVDWIKVSTDFYKNEKLLIVRSLAKGDRLVEHVWILLLALAGKRNNGGRLTFNDQLPYNAEMLATEYSLPLTLVETALSIFVQLGMVVIEDNVYRINGWEEHQNIEKLNCLREKDKLRKREERARQKSEKTSTEPPREETPTQTKPTNKDHINEVIFTDD